MNFGEAIVELKAGKRVARTGWNGKGIFLELQIPDQWSKMTQPYIYIETHFLQTDNPDAPKGRVPWLLRRQTCCLKIGSLSKLRSN